MNFTLKRQADILQWSCLDAYLTETVDGSYTAMPGKYSQLRFVSPEYTDHPSVWYSGTAVQNRVQTRASACRLQLERPAARQPRPRSLLLEVHSFVELFTFIYDSLGQEERHSSTRGI